MTKPTRLTSGVRSSTADTPIDRRAVLSRLAATPPTKQRSEAEQLIEAHRGLIRRVIRAGHSLQVLADELKLPKRTLQRQLTKAGLFFRTPRVNKGVAIRPYKTRKKAGR
jgi:hypothetical protein